MIRILLLAGCVLAARQTSEDVITTESIFIAPDLIGFHG